MTEEVEKKSKAPMIIIIILVVVGILVVAAVLGTIVIAGGIMLWAQDLSESEDTVNSVETMNVKGELDDSDDLLTLEVISGTYAWSDYSITVDGYELTLTSDPTSSAGETAIFSGGSYTAGSIYNVKIVNIAEDKVIWEDDIIARY